MFDSNTWKTIMYWIVDLLIAGLYFKRNKKMHPMKWINFTFVEVTLYVAQKNISSAVSAAFGLMEKSGLNELDIRHVCSWWSNSDPRAWHINWCQPGGKSHKNRLLGASSTSEMTARPRIRAKSKWIKFIRNSSFQKRNSVFIYSQIITQFQDRKHLAWEWFLREGPQDEL